MVSALGDAIPRVQQRLELREGGVHLTGHWTLLGLLLDDLSCQLLQIAQHRRRVLKNLDLALELRFEPRERDRVLRVVLREAIDLDGGGSMVECPPQIGRKRLVCLPVETELE